MHIICPVCGDTISEPDSGSLYWTAEDICNHSVFGLTGRTFSIKHVDCGQTVTVRVPKFVKFLL